MVIEWILQIANGNKTFHVFRIKQVKSEASTQTVLTSPRVGVGIVANSRSVPDGLLAYILKLKSNSCWSTKRAANLSVDAQQSLATLKRMEVFLGPSSAPGPTGRPFSSKFCANGFWTSQSCGGRSSKLPGIQSFEAKCWGEGYNIQKCLVEDPTNFTRRLKR